MIDKKSNDIYIVGTYTWAMAQLKLGKKMRRVGWSQSNAVLVLDTKADYHPTREDKKRLDWVVVKSEEPLPPLLMVASDASDYVFWVALWLMMAAAVSIGVYLFRVNCILC